jgi:hypothetical protein
VLALAFTACSNDDSPDDSRAVRFGTVVSPSTRGAEFTKTDLQKPDYGFKVSAYNQGTVLEWANYTPYVTADFMDNTKVTYDGDAWEYAPITYWPGKADGVNYGRVSFFAIGGLKSDKLKITYNPETNKPEAFADYYYWDTPGSQYDLVAATLFDQYWTSGSGQVKFKFDHILSRISFAAKLAHAPEPGVTVEARNVGVRYTKGKVRRNGIYTFGLEDPAWREPAEPLYMQGTSGGWVLNNGSRTPLTESAQQLVYEDMYLHLIPQSLEDGDLFAFLEYTISTADDVEPVEYTVLYPLPATTYLPGKQYIYTFNLTLNPVVFDVETDVTGWKDGDTGGDLEL